jgi:flagellar motor switch protein FliN
VAKKVVESVELQQLDAVPGKRKVVTAPALEVVRDVKVRLTAVLGEVSLTVGELFEMAENSVVSLNTLVDEDIELVLGDRVIARGALVIADDYFGIQISEIMKKE